MAAGGVRLWSWDPIGIVGQPMTNGKPDAAACAASFSASNFERVYGPGMSSADSTEFFATAPFEGEEWKRMDSVEQCRNRATPRLRAAAMTTCVPPQLTVWKSS